MYVNEDEMKKENVIFDFSNSESIDLKSIIDTISVKEIKKDNELGPEEIQIVKNILGDWDE